MQKVLKIVTAVNYWAIVLLPFSVGIAPGFANTVIGVIFASFFIEKIIKKEKIFNFSLPVALFLLFILISLLSFFNTSNLKDSVHGITKLLKFFFLFTICSQNIKDKKHFERIAISIACAVSLLGIDAIWQIITGKDFIRGNALQDRIGLVRATAAFPGCNGLGVYLTGLTPIIAGIALFVKEKRWRVIFALVALIGSIGVYLTLSRGAGIGLFVSVLFLSIVRRNKLVITALIFLIIAYPFIMPKNIKDWVRSVNYNPVVVLLNEDRIGIYRNTIRMIKKHPFVGIGINTFSKKYSDYRDPEVERTNPTADGYYAHNNFLHMAGEVGLFGLGVFLLFLFFVFKSIWAAFKKNTDYCLKAFAVSIFAGLLAYLINGLTETSLYYSRIVMIFYFMVGLGLALTKLTDKNETAKNQ